MATLGTKRFWITLATTLVLGAFFIGCPLLLAPAKQFNPQITLTVHGYVLTNRTHYLISEKDSPWDTPNPPRVVFSTGLPAPKEQSVTNSSTLIANVTLCNTGTQPIGFQSQSKVPYSRLDLLLGKSRVQCRYDYLTGGPQVLRPKETVDFWVRLPPDTTEWRFGFAGFLPSARLRVAHRLLDSGYVKYFPTFLIYLFPSKDGPDADIVSEVFQVPNPLPIGEHRSLGPAKTTSP